MISSESRMREIRTSGLMSGGEETWLRPRLRHRHRAKAAGNRLLPRAYGRARLPSTLQAQVGSAGARPGTIGLLGSAGILAREDFGRPSANRGPEARAPMLSTSPWS